MKNVKTCLSLVLVIVFCSSINIFAMEPEGSDRSGEWSEEDQPNISGESDTNNKHILKEQMNYLDNILQTSYHRMLHERTTNEEYNQLMQLFTFGKNTWTTAQRMLLNRIPIDTAHIYEKIISIVNFQEKIKENNHLMVIAQINKLQNGINTIKNILNNNQKISHKYNELQALLHDSQVTISMANSMLSDAAPIDIILLEKVTNVIEAELNKILKD